MADVKWIKIVTDIFDDEKIQIIESMPEGDAIALIWFKLLCLAGKTNQKGVLMLTDKMPYTDDMLATIFRRDVKLIRLALDMFQRLSMVEIIENAVCIINWEKHQNAEGLDKIREQTRIRVQRYRHGQALITDGNDTCNVTVTQSNALRTKIQNKIQKETEVARARDGGFLSDSEADELMQNSQQLNAVFDAAERAGFPHTQADLDRLNLIVADYGTEAVLNAIDKAVDAGTTTRTWRYLRGILKSDPTGGTREKQAEYDPTMPQEFEG